MEPIQQVGHPIMIHDAFGGHPDLLQYMLGSPILRSGQRDQRREPKVIEPHRDAFPRDFGGETLTPEGREKPVSDLDLVAPFDLEMAANEDAERRALQGELKSLAESWREAEEVAAIADHLLDDVS